VPTRQTISKLQKNAYFYTKSMNIQIKKIITTLKRLQPMHYLGHNLVSSWVILAIDFSLVAVSLFISHSLFGAHSQNLYGFTAVEFYKTLIPIILVSVVGHYIFKPHRGVIRHTSLHDIKLVFFARSASFALNILFIFVLSGYLNLDSYALPFSVAFVNYLISLYLLIQFRLAIKYTFNLGKKALKKPRIIIYGAGQAGQIVYDTLASSYDILAFIDDNPSMKNKMNRGINILHVEDQIVDFIAKKGITEIVISVQNCTPLERRMIVSRCSDWNLNVKSIPPIDKWINGELTSSQIKQVKIEDLLGRDVIQLDKENLRIAMQGRTVLVTGAAGSIGSELARQILYYKPSRVLLVDHAETPLYHLELELPLLSSNAYVPIEYILGDVTDKAFMENIFISNQIDIVYHAAAYKHVPSMEKNPIQAIQINVLGTKIIADLASKYNVRKMVFVSTDKAVNPTNVMGASKRAAEMYVQSKNAVSKTKYITTRFGNVLGSNGSVIPLFKKQIEAGGPLTVTHPEITRYFMTIPEACQLVLEASTIGDGGEIFVFDMGESVKIKDLAEKMIRLSGLVPGKDIQIKYSGLRPGEKLYEELLNTSESVLPTHHQKIMIGKVHTPSYRDVNFMLTNLQEIIDIAAGENALVSCLKQLVPEYKSQNSRFESLDFS
jgi:FlaA1/EpsC-like NDP-sugar epimerase